MAPADSMTIVQPTPDEIRAARTLAGHTQAEAAILVHAARRSWEAWESTSPGTATRAIPLASWELYLLKTGLHPELKIEPARNLQQLLRS